MRNHIEIFTGRIGQIDKEVKELSNNNCVANFSVAETPRVKKGDNWVDGTTIWTNVAIFGDEARNLVKSNLAPGTFVTVFGNRTASEYTPKGTEEKRTSQSVIAEQVAVAITRWNFIEGIGNINYNEAGRGGGATGGTTSKASTKATSTETKADGGAFEDPFGEGADDPFGLGE